MGNAEGERRRYRPRIGAGKSTSMRMVLGLDRPTAGQALVDGRPYQELRAPLRVVGALLDAGAVHPRRSARSHLLALARSNGIARSRVEEVLSLVGLDKVAGKRAGAYSLGMRQRLGIAHLGAETGHIGWPSMLGRTLGAEWTKLVSVRSTYGSLLAAVVVVTVGIAALAGWATITDDQATPATATQLAGVGAFLGQFGLVAPAALAITGEFATGSIRTTLAATPARWAVLAAKAAIVGTASWPSALGRQPP